MKYKHMWDFVINLKKDFSMFNKSSSEMRRWFENKSVLVNGEVLNWDSPVPSEFQSMVIFYKSKNKITIW